MKVIHFDVGQSQEDYRLYDSHDYFDGSVNSYLTEEKTLDADIVTCFPTSCFDRKTIDSVTGLKLIITRSIGVDNIDTNYCNSKGIKYLNIQYSRYNVAHHTLALILFYARKLNESFEQVNSGIFCHEKIDCLDLKIRTLGIIGYGRIGKEVAELADAFNIKVIAYDRKYRGGDIIDGFEMFDLDDLLSISDIISLHCDANPTNIDMINDENIKKMKDGVALINTARGSIINEEDLIKNINKFSFIGLDVLQDEDKFDNRHPLLGCKNVYITPHVAYKSEVTTRERWDQTYQHIEDFIKSSQ